METIPGIKTIDNSNSIQYIIYGFNYSKLCDNNMTTFLFPTKELATNAFLTIQHFLHYFNMCYDGGELGSGRRRCDRYYLDEVLDAAIGARIFTTLDNDTIIGHQGHEINIKNFVNASNDLMKYQYNNKLYTGKYDEFTLAVLRYMKLKPRIKRTSFSFNPFKPDYKETDEKTIRQMKLII
jgi:hypothetical protein